MTACCSICEQSVLTTTRSCWQQASVCGPSEGPEGSDVKRRPRARARGSGAPRAVIEDDRTLTIPLRHRAKRAVIALLAICVLLGDVSNRAFAQHAEGALPHDFDEPIKLYKVGLGTFT